MACLEGDPVLPGYRLPIAELFGWLKLRRIRILPHHRKPGSSVPGESTR